MNPVQLTDDLEQKARKLNIQLSFDALPFGAFYRPAFKDAHVQRIMDWGTVFAPDDTFSIHETPEVAYFVALHELGHAATLPRRAHHPFYRSSDGETLEFEAAAWDWAVNNSAIPITNDMRRMASAALEHYRFTSRDMYAQAYPPELWRQTVDRLNNLAVAA